MEISAKILVADENIQTRHSTKEALVRKGYRNVEEAANGEEALIKINRSHPDIVIADIWLSKLDGIGLIKNTKGINFGNDQPPAFIIASMVTNQNVFIEATNAGASMCLMKPFDFSSLCEHIDTLYRSRESASPDSKPNREDIETQVTKVIHQIGVPAHIKGYQYLSEAIAIVAATEDISAVKVKDIYKQVANVFQATSSMVERAIRHAIEIAWDSGGEELLKMFPNCDSIKYPGSRAFIILVAEKVQLKKAEYTTN